MGNIATVLDSSIVAPRIVLPLAISFFTFQQIAFLVDVFRRDAREPRLVDYTLFVTFFPQLIAGPIVHHSEMMPQFTRRGAYRANSVDLSIGFTIFTIGLVKKVMIADPIALWADPVFDAALAGSEMTLLEAWSGALAYAAQIYFDFSGYSDMAIGIARCFGIRLPLNFNSPYKAVSIIDFWRRWHMTLSRFLRDYLYYPLGGNRRGKSRRYANLMTVMLLGGLWHGAGWTFVVWGGLHGLYLVVNHGWRALRRGREGGGIAARVTGIAITFMAVTVAWVFFRAESFEAAWRVLRAMLGLNGVDLSNRFARSNAEGWLVGITVIVWFLPNTQEFMRRARPAVGCPRPIGPRLWWEWRPSAVWAWLTAIAFIYTVMHIGAQASEFIYYQF